MTQPTGTPAQAQTAQAYRRDTATWIAFAALFGFGLLNATLGPALPYLRAAEGISYLTGALHQAAFAVGGGLAGMLATRAGNRSRRATTCLGLTGAALAALALGYGDAAPVTIAAALLLSGSATTALIRVWASLADLHRQWRAVAMTEGEVAVSVAGILIPALVGALATTALGWRFAFVIAAVIVAITAILVGLSRMPTATPPVPAVGTRDAVGHRRRPPSTLVIVFAIVALEFTLSFWVASYLNDDVGLPRDAAAATVSGLYAANLVGRLLASRLVRRVGAHRLLAGALGLALLGLPVLLAADGAAIACVGIVVAGTGIGATFPLTASLHVAASSRTADQALGEILTVAAVGQLTGPLAAGALAEASSLRIGLLVLPALTLLAAAALIRHAAGARTRGPRPANRPTTRSAGPAAD